MPEIPAVSDPGKDNRAIAAAGVKLLPGGSLLAVMIEQKRWTLLLGVVLAVWFLLLYPLLLPIISAALINQGALMGAHKPYAAAVRQAFRADEFAEQLARDSNQRMDYFQVIEYVGDATKLREYSLSVVPNQRLRFRIEKAKLHSDNPACSVPAPLADEGVKLFTMEMEGQSIASIDNPPNFKTVSLTASQWEQISPNVENGRLSFKVVPVPELAAVRCSGLNVHVRIAFEIYKDLVVVVKKSGVAGAVQ